MFSDIPGRWLKNCGWELWEMLATRTRGVLGVLYSLQFLTAIIRHLHYSHRSTSWVSVNWNREIQVQISECEIFPSKKLGVRWEWISNDLSYSGTSKKHHAMISRIRPSESEHFEHFKWPLRPWETLQPLDAGGLEVLTVHPPPHLEAQRFWTHRAPIEHSQL